MDIFKRVRACELCKHELPFPPRPILQGSASAKILIAGQAPGATTHAKGIAFDDPSGERLRAWMGIDKSVFYDEKKISVVPMGFCFPGYKKSKDGTKNVGDLPPIPRCAATWRNDVLAAMPDISLTLVIGQYALLWHLGEQLTKAKTLTALVKNWRDYAPLVFPMPHPSPRNNRWLKQNPWFEAELLPALQKRVAKLI